MSIVNTIDLIKEALDKNEANFKKKLAFIAKYQANIATARIACETKKYNETKARLEIELAEEIAEPSHFEYRANKDKIYLKVVRLGRGIDRKATINLSNYIKDCEYRYEVDMERVTCGVMGQLQSCCNGIREYYGKNHPKNKDDFKQWDVQKWRLVDYTEKRITKLLKGK